MDSSNANNPILNATAQQNNMSPNGMSAEGNDATTQLLRHKAMKYHYKTQDLLNLKFVSKGVPVPSGYEKFLQPFQG